MSSTARRFRVWLAKKLLPRDGYAFVRVKRCDSECWQTGHCTGACER